MGGRDAKRWTRHLLNPIYWLMVPLSWGWWIIVVDQTMARWITACFSSADPLAPVIGAGIWAVRILGDVGVIPVLLAAPLARCHERQMAEKRRQEELRRSQEQLPGGPDAPSRSVTIRDSSGRTIGRGSLR
jgi:hypothetical protein